MAAVEFDETIVRRGTHVFIRRKHVDLADILNKLESNIYHIHLYCHSLEYTSVETSESKEQNAPGFTITKTSSLKLYLYFEYATPNLYFLALNGQVFSLSREVKAQLDNDADWLLDDSVSKASAKGIPEQQFLNLYEAEATREAVGFKISLADSEAKVNRVSQVPLGEFESSEVMKSVTSFDLDPKLSIFGNLPKLLNALFFEACDLMFKAVAAGGTTQVENEWIARQNLSFIKRCTNSCPTYSTLHQHTEEMLRRLQLAQSAWDAEGSRFKDVTVSKFFVPTQNYSNYYKLLSASLKEFESLRHAIERLDSENRVVDEIRALGVASLSAIEEMGKETVSNQPSYEAVMQSMNAVSDQRTVLANRKQEILEKRLEFLKGLDEYQFAKKRQRDIAMAMGACDILITVTVAVFVNPAALVPTLGDVLMTTKDIIFEIATDSGGTGQKDVPAFTKPQGKDTSKDPHAPEVKDVPGDPYIDDIIVVDPKYNGPKLRGMTSAWVQVYEDPDYIRSLRSPSSIQPPFGLNQSQPSKVSSEPQIVSQESAPKITLPEQFSSSLSNMDRKDSQLRPRDQPRLIDILSQSSLPQSQSGSQVVGGEKPVNPQPKLEVVPQPKSEVNPQPKAEDPKKGLKQETQKASQKETKTTPAAPTIYTNVRSSGLAIWKAHKAYENNPIIRGQGGAGKQQKTSSAIAAVTAQSEQFILSSSPPIDFFAVLAEWDEVAAKVEDLFTSLKADLKEDRINGLDEFRLAMLNLVYQGRALIANQQELQKNMQAFFRANAEKERREARQLQIKKLKTQLMDQPLALEPYKEDLKASCPIIARKMLLNMHRCILSLKYRYSWDHGSTIDILSDMTFENWRDVVTELEEKKLASGDKVLATQKQPKIKMSTDDNAQLKVFASDWQKTLTETQKIPFNIPLDLKHTKNECDARILDISAEFSKSGQEQPLRNVRYEIYLGPNFIDRDRKRGINCFHVGDYNITKVDQEGEWKFASADDEVSPVRPGLFGPGYIYFDPETANVPLHSIDKVELIVTVQAYTMKHSDRK